MKYSRQMVLISEDEYSQLKNKASPKTEPSKERATESSATLMSLPSEKITQPSQDTEKITQTGLSEAPCPTQRQWVLPKAAEKMPGEKNETKISPHKKQLTKTSSTRRIQTQSGPGVETFTPLGPPGIPLRTLQKKSTSALPLGWIDF